MVDRTGCCDANVIFHGTILSNFLYPSALAGNTLLEDVTGRPVLALTGLVAIVAGIFAFIVGMVAILRKKERALSVYVATAFGALLVLFLLGEFIFSH